MVGVELRVGRGGLVTIGADVCPNCSVPLKRYRQIGAVSSEEEAERLSEVQPEPGQLGMCARCFVMLRNTPTFEVELVSDEDARRELGAYWSMVVATRAAYEAVRAARGNQPKWVSSSKKRSKRD